jgi:glucose-fructose oxidoreductase
MTPHFPPTNTMNSSLPLRFVGINFDHMHMGDLLRLVHETPGCEIAGICDEHPARMTEAISKFDIPAESVFSDYNQCLETTRPDVAILCPATGEHALWTERVAAHSVHILMEKPFAASLADADRMIAAMRDTGKFLAINWPLRWYANNVTAHRLVREGRIGQLQEVHYYGGNRGPVCHGADKEERTPTAEDKAASWFYDKSKGGGSLLDYLGYGVTLGTWFNGSARPMEVTSVVDIPPGLEVDEHSVTIARYSFGLSKFETRWGTFTDPWTQQPQPKCGFVLKGSSGTISSYDYETTIRLQDSTHPEGVVLPADEIASPHRNPVEYFADCIRRGLAPEGPLDPAVSRIGQEIVDAAVRSAAEKRTLPL